MLWTRVLSLLILTWSSAASAQVLIPVANRRDHVFDNVHNILYITTSRGTVERYNVATNTLLTPFTASGSQFNGIDISLDDQYVYVADGGQYGPQGIFRKFNTSTGDLTNLFYTRQVLGGASEGEAWDITVTNAGHAIVTTDYNGSGFIPMRRLDLATDTFSSAIKTVSERTILHRSSIGNWVFYLEGNETPGPYGVYDPATQTFPAAFVSPTSPNDDRLGAVNRNGTLVARENESGGVDITSNKLFGTRRINGLLGGIGFSPVFDIIYGVDINTDQVIAFNTNTLAEIARYPIGENVVASNLFSNGSMSFSRDGRLLFLSTPTGIRMLTVVPEPSSSITILIGLFTFAIRYKRRRAWKA